MAWLRDNDQWLIDRVLPSAADYLNLARKIVGPNDADDVVHDAYARLLAYDRWREVINPRALCLRIVRNIGIDRLRLADVVHINRLAAIEDIEVPDDQPDAFRIVEGRDAIARLLQIIDTLPPQCRQVVRMRKLEGYSPHAIATSLGISVSTVEKHLSKGLLAIVESLEDGKELSVVRSRRWISRRKRR